MKFEKIAGIICIFLPFVWSISLGRWLQESLKVYHHAAQEESLFLLVITLMNMLLPVICLAGIFTAGLLILRHNRWGYYVAFIFIAGLLAQRFFQ